MADIVKDVIASAVRNALHGTPGGMVSWKYEIARISPLETLIKVWPDEDRPPRYFVVQVREMQ